MAGYRVNFTLTLYITAGKKKVMINFVSDKFYILIEKVAYFKYLGYRMSEYKSDLEDKLQTYNKKKVNEHKCVLISSTIFV